MGEVLKRSPERRNGCFAAVGFIPEDCFRERQLKIVVYIMKTAGKQLTLSSHHITRITVDFQAMLDPHWPEWKAIDARLFQMAERCGLEQELAQVLLRTKLGRPGDVVDGRKLLPKYLDIGSVELKLNCYNQRGG